MNIADYPKIVLLSLLCFVFLLIVKEYFVWRMHDNAVSPERYDPGVYDVNWYLFFGIILSILVFVYFAFGQNDAARLVGCMLGFILLYPILLSLGASGCKELFGVDVEFYKKSNKN